MDIHKPKPWHGWRELLKEIGTIVIGVLIALGAEQAVEWLHRQQEVGEAREALKDEMSRNARSMKINIAEAPCVQARLDDIAAWAKGGPPPNSWNPGRLGALDSSAWDEARTSVVPHMPLKMRIAYDRFYAAAANRQTIGVRERDAFAVLIRYSAEPQVPVEMRHQALQDVTLAKVQVGILAAADAKLLSMVQEMGVTPQAFTPADAAALAQLCERPPGG